MFQESALQQIECSFIEYQAAYKDFLLTFLGDIRDLPAQKALGEVLMEQDTVIFPEKKITMLKISDKNKKKLEPFKKSISKATKALRDKYHEELYELKNSKGL